MNTQLKISNVKGKNEISLTITPAGNLERTFFQELFSGEVEVKTIPNTDDIVITRKEDPEK